MSNNEEAVQTRFVQVTNKTGPDGRAVLLVGHTKEERDVIIECLLGVVWYSVHVALIKEFVQKRGAFL